MTSWKKIWFFFIKNCNLPIPRPPKSMSKLQKKPSALKRGHPPLQNMNFYKFFLLLWVIFALLDPDPDSESGSGSTDPIESGSGSATLFRSHIIKLYHTCYKADNQWKQYHVRSNCLNLKRGRKIHTNKNIYGSEMQKSKGFYGFGTLSRAVIVVTPYDYIWDSS